MNKSFQTYLTTKWPAIIWSAIVFVLLAMPGDGLPSEELYFIPHFDKLVHATLFFILVWLWVKHLKAKNTVSSKALFLITLAATAYGVAMEFVQIYTGRDFSVGDMLADGVGAFLGALITQKK